MGYLAGGGRYFQLLIKYNKKMNFPQGGVGKFRKVALENSQTGLLELWTTSRVSSYANIPLALKEILVHL